MTRLWMFQSGFAAGVAVGAGLDGQWLATAILAGFCISGIIMAWGSAAVTCNSGVR